MPPVREMLTFRTVGNYKTLSTFKILKTNHHNVDALLSPLHLLLFHSENCVTVTIKWAGLETNVNIVSERDINSVLSVPY